MPRFQNLVLGNLRTVFGFKGTANIEGVAEGDAAPTLDVGRFAKLGVGFGDANGFWTFTRSLTANNNIATGTDTIFINTNVLNLSFLQNHQSAPWVCWILDVWAGIDGTAALYVNSAIGLSLALPDAGGPNTHGQSARLLFYDENGDINPGFNGPWTPSGGRALTGTGSPAAAAAVAARIRYPIPVYGDQGGGTLIYQVESGGVGDVTLHANVLVWVGRKGMLPPGLA